MDISIVDAIQSPGPSHCLTSPNTNQSLSETGFRSRKRKKTTGSRAPRSSGARGNLDFGECDDMEAYGHRLSAEAKEALKKLKKPFKDPFDDELQEVMDKSLGYLHRTNPEDVDLAEAALMLAGCTDLYAAQVDSVQDYVLGICNRITGGKVPHPKGRKRKLNAETDGTGVEENKSQEEEGVPQVGNKGGKEGKDPDAETLMEVGCENALDLDATEVIETLDSQEPAINNDKEGAGQETSSVKTDNNQNEMPGEIPELSGDAIDENGDPEKEATVEEVKKLETEILQEIPGRCTRRQSARLMNILNLEKVNEREYKLKKRKFDDDPPELISCIEEWNQLLAYMKLRGDVDFDEILPPVLEVQVGRKRKKVTINNNDITSDDNNESCEACHGDFSSTGDNSGLEKTDKGSDNKLQSTLSLTIASSSGLNGQQYETLDHLPDDVQENFHALIQEMHKLPFDYGLMQQDMFKAYQQKFLQAVSLLSQNSVLVKRNEKGESDAAAGAEQDTQSIANCLELNDSQMSESDQTISSIAELLNQVRQQATEEYNKGKQTKADAEVPVSQMIATLKRIICSRYKKWHVRTDSDKGVFQRIKEFEDKVKAVLRREAEQGLFDVKKYEMEVMDVTMKESQDGESDELFGCPLSPIPSTSIIAVEGGSGAKSPGNPENWALSSSSRRTSLAGSIDGSSSWIRLYDIFSQMKKIDNSETCRHFYAVLALLSHKNLNINYDTLFSHESAKLITKLIKNQNDNGNVAEKYPVGAKIMTSRCPDVDQDDVLIAPVFNAETFYQVLEQDGYLSSSGYQSDGQASGSTTTGQIIGHSLSQGKNIQDVLNEFVVDPGEPFPEELFRNNRRKKY